MSFKRSRKELLFAAASGLCIAGLAPNSGVAQQTQKVTSSYAEEIADKAGRVAGAATYCEIDEEDVDHFIDLAQGKIASMVEDPVDRVVLRIRFDNEFSLGASREPEGGCELLGSVFEAQRRGLE